MTGKNESNNNTEASSDKNSENESENVQRQNYSMNLMHLMKEWYARSSEMLNYMLNSFSNPAGKNPDGSDSNSKEPDQKDESIWNGYIENIERVMKDFANVYGIGPEQMDAVYNSWKDFLSSMTKYFNPDNIESDSNLGISSEVWTKWFEYTNTMNRKLFECYYAQEPTSGMAPPLSTMTGSSIRTGIPCDNVSQLDEQSLNEMNEIFSRYYADITKEYMAANEAVMFKNETAMDKSQEFLEKWTSSYDKFIKELIRTRSFNVILNDNIKQSLDAKKQFDDTFENQWKILGLPTRNDIMELHRTIHDLQLKLNRLHKDFKEFDAKMNSKESK
ncbi:MAG: IpaD/SipD/SspD family type III secretion system needle tip protein [bacterium]|nr:MAG: IpaD/SipD/SspD family type III secretion system needle tip protein [bacterium]